MHYTCLVIGPDYEAQLEPFDENISVDPYKTYWDSDTLEHWESILRETTTMRGQGEERQEVEYPPEQVLTQDEYTLEDMVRVYHARYRDNDEHAKEDELQIDDGGIFEWSTYNPKSKWDWYKVGGRWTGYFKLKPGTDGEVGRPSLMTEPAKNGYVDAARKGDVDVDGMRDDAGEKAASVWDRVHAVISHLPEALGWEEHFVGRLKLAEAGEDEYTIEQAREEYHAQPRVVALKEWNESLPDEEKVVGWFGPGVEDFQVCRDEYIRRARDSVLAPYAYLYEGEWHAPGKMGWFSSSETAGEQRRFQREFNDLLDSLPDDTELTLVDLHI